MATSEDGANLNTINDIQPNEEDKVKDGSGSESESGAADDEDPIIIGGPSDTPSFCYLDGIHEDPETGDRERIQIPLTTLPATLGRSHDTFDPHFFGLGKRKAVSRKQCMIYYRDEQGGRVDWDAKKGELVYQKPTQKGAKNTDLKNDTSGSSSGRGGLPKRGFFVIECLGKNRIMVNRRRIDQGEAAVLESGSPIRISSYMLYFLLPTDATPKVHTVPVPTRKSSKKRKATTAAADAPASTRKPPGYFASLQAELDALDLETLLKRMTAEFESKEFGRRHQFIGSTIAVHVVRHAARAPEIQRLALNGGVSRNEILDWIDKSVYREWVGQMLSKMEVRSYQALLTKSLLKAGFTRTSSTGRYVKWYLPNDITIVINRNESPEKEAKVEKTKADDGEGQQEEATGGEKQAEGEEEEQEQEEEEDTGGDGIVEGEEDEGDGKDDDEGPDDENNEEDAVEKEEEGGEESELGNATAGTVGGDGEGPDDGNNKDDPIEKEGERGEESKLGDATAGAIGET